MGNFFSEMNCIKATVITETNNEPYFDEVKKDENIPEDVKEPNPICDKNLFAFLSCKLFQVKYSNNCIEINIIHKTH